MSGAECERCQQSMLTLLHASVDMAQLRGDLRAAERINAIQAAHIAVLQNRLQRREPASHISIFHRPQAG